MFFYSKPFAFMGFNSGFASKFAVNAASSPTSLTLLQTLQRYTEFLSSPWGSDRTGTSMNFSTYGSVSSPSEFPPISKTFANGLPPSGSSKPPRSSNLASLSFPPKLSSPRKIEALCTKDGHACLRSSSDIATSKVPRTLAYRRTLLQPRIRAQVQGSRGLHNSSVFLGRYKSGSRGDCTPTKEICRSKKNDCGQSESCRDKESECYPKKVKCEPKEQVKEDVEDKEICPTSCVRGGKCIIAVSKKPAKMVYGSTECPPPKLISPRSCPRTSPDDYAHEEPVCPDKAPPKKLRKDVCVPPPLPGPPTDPVPLCPCPPPPKLHPGPCPCPEQKEEILIKPTPTCPLKDKYPCCLPNYYCPPKEPCVRKLPCDQQLAKKTK